MVGRRMNLPIYQSSTAKFSIWNLFKAFQQIQQTSLIQCLQTHPSVSFSTSMSIFSPSLDHLRFQRPWSRGVCRGMFTHIHGAVYWPRPEAAGCWDALLNKPKYQIDQNSLNHWWLSHQKTSMYKMDFPLFPVFCHLGENLVAVPGTRAFGTWSWWMCSAARPTPRRWNTTAPNASGPSHGLLTRKNGIFWSLVIV